MMNRETLREMATRAGLVEEPPSLLGREMLLLAMGMAVGALIMYILDPEQGQQRRAHARERVTHLRDTAGQRFGETARTLGSRARGMAEEARSAMSATEDDGGQTAH
jgi:hypothetical protein